MTDWNELRVRYVSGKMSLRKLAEENGVSYSQVTKHASTEKWREQRKLFGKKAADNAIAHAQARAQANLERALEVTEGLLQVSVEALQDQDQFRRYLVQRSDGGGSFETREEVFRKVDTKAVKDLTEAVEKLTRLLREFHNKPTEAEMLEREKTKEQTKQAREQTKKIREDIRRMKEDTQDEKATFIIRRESEEEYRARTGDTEAEPEAGTVLP